MSKNRESRFSLFRTIVMRLYKPVIVFVMLLIANFILSLFRFAPKTDMVLDKAMDILFLVSFAWILVGFLNAGRDYGYHLYDLKKEDNLRERKVRTQIQFIRKLLVVVIITLTICAILLSFENLRKIGSGLLASVGVGGIIIGFAAQRSIANVLAGMQIAFTQPLRMDDVLIVEGEWGRVEEITLTYVVVNIWDQRRLILPINYFLEKPFQNWTRNSSEILGTVFLYLDYTMPVEALRTEFKRLLNESPIWDKRVGVVQVTETSEHTIQIRVLVSARNSGQAFDLRCYIRENLITFIQQNYPQCLPRTRAELSGWDKERQPAPTEQ